MKNPPQAPNMPFAQDRTCIQYPQQGRYMQDPQHDTKVQFNQQEVCIQKPFEAIRINDHQEVETTSAHPQSTCTENLKAEAVVGMDCNEPELHASAVSPSP